METTLTESVGVLEGARVPHIPELTKSLLREAVLKTLAAAVPHSDSGLTDTDIVRIVEACYCSEVFTGTSERETQAIPGFRFL